MRTCCICLMISLAPWLHGQTEPPACLSADEDHRLLMETLGISALRPGRSPDSTAANAANYDPALADPWPDLPDPLRTDKGKVVKDAAQWWDVRRPEIVEHFEREVYGRVPADLPGVTWEVVFQEVERIGWTPVTVKKLRGRVDNASYPPVEVNLSMVVITPASAPGPVPLLMMFGPARVPAPNQPSREDFGQLNQVLRSLISQDSGGQAILDKYPAYEPLLRPPGYNPWGFWDASSLADGRVADLVQGGWGCAFIEPASIQADNGEGLTCSGIIALANRGQPRKPDDWGVLRAWAWGAGCGLDYLEGDPDVDANRVGIEGVSRYGKAALVAMAFDSRFAFGLIGSSGKGGATLHRRNFGESVENLAGLGAYHWMAGNYLKYAAADGVQGEMNASLLPVDSQELIALCAPRPVFISFGIPEEGDAHWLDHQGSYMAAVAAQGVYRLLGARGLGVSDDYRTERMPPVTHGMLEGDLAWRQHTGGHTDAPNILPFMAWAEKRMNEKPQP